MQDPRIAGVASTRVQIQNRSQFDLAVTAGGEVWTVTAQQSTTIRLHPDHVGFGWQLTNNGTGSASGAIVGIFMVTGEHAPQPDGPLTGGAF
jgi:hypothetical protein